MRLYLSRSVQRACTPTRAALMTGRYNIRYGFASGVLKPLKPYGLPTNETIVPEYLNALGFESHMIGKWHVSQCCCRCHCRCRCCCCCCCCCVRSIHRSLPRHP